jgi:hypothetical protein
MDHEKSLTNLRTKNNFLPPFLTNEISPPLRSALDFTQLLRPLTDPMYIPIPIGQRPSAADLAYGLLDPLRPAMQKMP